MAPSLCACPVQTAVCLLLIEPGEVTQKSKFLLLLKTQLWPSRTAHLHGDHQQALKGWAWGHWCPGSGVEGCLCQVGPSQAGGCEALGGKRFVAPQRHPRCGPQGDGFPPGVVGVFPCGCFLPDPAHLLPAFPSQAHQAPCHLLQPLCSVPALNFILFSKSLPRACPGAWTYLVSLERKKV